MPAISNLPTSKAKLIRELLRDRKIRQQERVFVLEGEKPIQELLAAHSPAVLYVVIAESRLRKGVLSTYIQSEKRSPVFSCKDSIFDKLSDVSSPAGVLAIVRQPVWNQEAIFKRPRLLGLYGEGLQDPANVGAIIRTALGFGLDALWLSPDSADTFNPKVVRATAGSLLTLPVFTVSAPDVFKNHDCVLFAAEPHSRKSQAILEIPTVPARAILAFGNESHGLSEATLQQAAVRFHIPVTPAIQSLNVAASVAVAAFHFSGAWKKD
ncbi:MAG TPA: RNA methyltransferase [Nitrospiraceae bacterium]|jgi:TrmH family RNA methyltransferase|nr:RNA methyltransferase [Nitrospiraceae bacterium]